MMVVDDDESIRNSLRKVLHGEGYQVVVASNGLEAMEVFNRERSLIDLLLVDLNMPMKNGWVTLNRLLEINPSLPVIIVTGISHQDELAEATGVRALVEKPIDVPELLLLIRRQLAEPANTRNHDSGKEGFLFHHLRAMSCFSHSRSTREHCTPYSHWGLND